MEGTLLQELLIQLMALMKEGGFKNRYLVIFGANAPGTVMVNFFESHDMQVGAVIDNNILLHGKAFLEITVSSPEDALAAYRDDALVLIGSKYYNEMKQQLEQMGYNEQEHIVQLLNFNENEKFDTSIEMFREAENKVRKGFSLYRRLVDKYGDATFIMAPVRPNGDVYMICSWLEAYEQEMAKLGDTNIVLTVIGNACEAVANLFDIKQIEKLTLEESNLLVAYASFLPDKIKIINPYSSHLELYRYVNGYKGLNFLDLMKHGLLDLPKNHAIVKPKHEYRQDIVQEVFDQYGLEEGNTIILAPYANSIPQIKWDVWEKVAVQLKDKNYKVFTNCGNADEKPIKGTEPVRFNFRDAVAVTEKAGYLIAYRSGFCDILADSKCRKVVVYPNHYTVHDKIRNFFGMDDDLYRQENLVQIENLFDTTDELATEIVRYFD